MRACGVPARRARSEHHSGGSGPGPGTDLRPFYTGCEPPFHRVVGKSHESATGPGTSTAIDKGGGP